MYLGWLDIQNWVISTAYIFRLMLSYVLSKVSELAQKTLPIVDYFGGIFDTLSSRDQIICCMLHGSMSEECLPPNCCL